MSNTPVTSSTRVPSTRALYSSRVCFSIALLSLLSFPVYSQEDVTIDSIPFEWLFKGGARYHHATSQDNLIHNFRIATEIEFLWGVETNLYVGAVTGVTVGVEDSDSPVPLLASGRVIINVPLYGALRYDVDDNVALQPYSGMLFNFTGSELVFYYIIGGQFILGPVAVDLAYLLNFNALANSAVASALFAHSFRVSVLALIPIIRDY